MVTSNKIEISNKKNDFIMEIKSFMDTTIPFIPFGAGNVAILKLENKSIFLWQNAKGDVRYCFSLFEKEPFTTTAIKLGNVLTCYFEYEIEVVNNTKEQLKKMMTATAGLNKALSDSERYNNFQKYTQENQLSAMFGGEDILQTVEQLNQYPVYNQEMLHKGVIQLSTYYLESHTGTLYIKLNELPIIHKEIFEPSSKQAFFANENGLMCRNKFISTELMAFPLTRYNTDNSVIMQFILFMAKNDTYAALKIIQWLMTSFVLLDKAQFALVLHAHNDTYMKLFYEEILEPLFHDFQCELIDNSNFDAKSLSKILDEKVVYNFHNIATPVIFDEAAYELTNRLLHKENIKINRKSVKTVANILITSTSKYIPMISQDVPTATVEIDNNVEALYKYLNISTNKKYVLADCIKNDLHNFVSILRTIDIQALNQSYSLINYRTDSNLLDGNRDATKIFDSLIKDKDITPFRTVAKTKKQQKLVDEIENNFHLNRVDKAHLLVYFEMLFGVGIYRSNRALIAILGKDHSSTKKPFNNPDSYVRTGRAYYFL